MISVTIQLPNVELGADWGDLVSRAHPNVFMSPAALRAADLTMFAKLHVLLAWDEAARPRRLVGLWALQERRTWSFGPTVLDALPFEYAFLSSPVIDKDVVAAVMPAFLKAVADAPTLPRVIMMKSLDTEAASFRPLVDAVEARGGRALTIKTESRPVIWRDTTDKPSSERRKKLRQCWKRMSAIGVTAMVAVTEPDAVALAVETFLDLEFKSWKGAAGTALLCREEDATFVRRMIGDLAAQGQAMVESLQIDGRTIATQILLLSGMMAYTWKTAFDQAFAKFSPGAVMIDKLTERLFASSTITGIDSCSVEGSFMGELWRDRRAMADVLVKVRPGLSISFWMEAVAQVGRERLKQWRDRIVAIQAARRAKRAVAAPAVEASPHRKPIATDVATTNPLPRQHASPSIVATGLPGEAARAARSNA